MPRPKKKRQYTEVKPRTIFLLKSPNAKEFYIGHTFSHNMRSTYKDHYIETKNKTENMIKELKSKGLKPCCFELETINCTAVQAYRHIIVWTKIFIEQGYKNLDTGSVVDYASQLLPENIPLYEERKNINLNEITSCEKCLYPNYGKTMCILRNERLKQNE